ncbi:helix-turn-helix domain-containing protein [Geochorda subterranea]|uniref:RodZ domain-containing protein n=1 Tax=Geochorda subterranea TaxID=3109564 RepID=A0ABZ1BSU3_9FIRM|nr:RodZ domain-containing protein [Limnochorda sp. LNt]WRP15849.1 RodZ domain-containing protein [Limnochorda sp. LNt]
MESRPNVAGDERGAAGPEPVERPEARGRLGAMLREAREARGLSLQAVSERTRVRAPFLEAIEEGRYEELPGPVYTRGFLKLYARAVGLDPARVLAAWEREAPQAARPEPVESGPPRRERARPWWMPDPLLRAIEPRERVRAAVSATLVVVVAAVAGTWLLSTATRPRPSDVARTPVPLEPLPSGETPEPRVLALGVPGLDEGSPSRLPEPHRPPRGPGGSGRRTTAPEPAPTASPRPSRAGMSPRDLPRPGGIAGPSAAATAPAGAERAGAGVEVVAVVREAGWLEAYVDGRRAFSGTAQAGETLRWRGQQLISLRLSRAEGVDPVVDGRARPGRPR